MDTQRYDVVVAGAGLTGFAAALAAARQGCRVLVFDQSNAFGGAAVNCLVNPFMPYWTWDPDTGEKKVLSAGIFREILDELEKQDALAFHRQTFDEEVLKLVLDRMARAAGVDVLFHAVLTDAQMEGSRVRSVTLAGRGKKYTVEADVFIDATGDGNLSVLCGCPYQLGREADSLCQPMTLCFRLGNIDLAKAEKQHKHMNELYKQFQREGKIKNPREDVLIFRTLHTGVQHFNSTRVVRLDPTDLFDVTKAEQEAREQVFELVQFLRENIEGYEHCELLSTAMETGVRESRMILGEYTLTGEDLVACTKFPDSIALGNYDIDIHNPEGSGTSHYYFPKGQYYTIPLRALQVKGMHNLLVAGRCLSATHEAQASVRIMPICCCTGEAAGVAAAVALQNGTGTGDVNVARVQDILRKNGALL